MIPGFVFHPQGCGVGGMGHNRNEVPSKIEGPTAFSPAFDLAIVET